MLHQPNLLVIIGSPKAGTTSLARWLGSRPDMVLGQQKEPRYFTDFADGTWFWSGPGSDSFQATLIKKEADYFQSFAHQPDAHWAIDASTDYLWRSEVSVEKIRAFCDKATVKLICLTCDPVKRAISEYNHTLAAKMETLSFRDALEAEADRSANGFQPLFRHQRRSRIHSDLSRYADAFGDDLLILDQDVLKDPEATNITVSRFLGIQVHPFENIKIHNQRALPKNGFAKWLLDARELRSAARKFIPKPVRHALWKGLQNPSAQVRTVTDDEIDYARDRLADEINLCKADPLIETSTWTLALR